MDLIKDRGPVGSNGERKGQHLPEHPQISAKFRLCLWRFWKRFGLVLGIEGRKNTTLGTCYSVEDEAKPALPVKTHTIWSFVFLGILEKISPSHLPASNSVTQ